MEESKAPLQRVAPLTALLLSALVLPGLGQILTGYMLRGAIMAAALLLWLPVAAVRVGRDLMEVLPPLSARAEAGEILTFSDLQKAMAPLADGMLWVFLPLVVIWVWALADSIRHLVQSQKYEV